MGSTPVCKANHLPLVYNYLLLTTPYSCSNCMLWITWLFTHG